MTNQVDTDSTDVGTYLGRIGARLAKEGNSLQALARMWGEDDLKIVRTFGSELIDLGGQLMELRKRLCRRFMMREVKILLRFADFPEAGKEGRIDVPGD